MAVVTISRQFGAGALMLGKRICAKTGFHIVDENMIHDIAVKENISKDWLESIAKESASDTLYVLSNIVSKGFFYKVPGIPSDEVERKKYAEILKRIMNDMADKGGFVIIGRGAQFILEDHPRAIHLLLVGELENRVRRVSQSFNLSSFQAKRFIRAKEKQRSNLARNIFKKKFDDPSHYHVVINTDKLPVDWAVDAATVFINKQLREEQGGE